MQIARLAAVAACVLLALAGCGTGYPAQTAQSARIETPAAAAERTPDDNEDLDDARKAIGNGLVLTITAPRPFTPTDTAYPRTSRAIAFEVTLDNGGTVAYRPASLAFTAIVNGSRTEQVIDSTQGYTGTTGVSDEIEPGESLRLAVAFAAPDEPSRLRLAVQRDMATASPILLFEGVV